MKFKPIKPKRIYKAIVEQIKESIVEGDLAPGDKLLSERELAQQLQVSRASVREALCALDIAGLIEIRPGEGTFVRRFNLNSIVEPLALMILVEKERIREVLEVRKTLEVEAVSMACERATEENLEDMQKALEEMERDLSAGESGASGDLNFHYAIAMATQNSILIRLMNTIHDTMGNTIGVTRKLWLSYEDGTHEQLLEEHKSIYRAIKARDKAKARKMMQQHLKTVEKGIERNYEEDNGGEGDRIS